MPLINESHDYLPYIDQPASNEALEAARNLISTETDPSHTKELHSSIPALSEPQISELMQLEVERKAKDPASQIQGGVDISRYESLDAPADSSTEREEWLATLRRAYAASTHVSGRLTNLALLEQFGKNAWLIGNSQLEDILRSLERELVDVREQQEQLEHQRREVQENARGEHEALTESWQTGISRLIEVEVAAEGVRQEILQRRRDAAAR